jgi:predicted nucleotidyltransferase
MQVDGNNKGGLNELLAAILNSKNKNIPKNELKQLLKRIEDDATEIYHTKYGSDGTRIKFNINSNEDPDAILVGRQSVKSLECIRKSIKKNLYLMKENVRTEFEGYLILCGEANNSN